ncbi:MAG TPA: DUF6600 domain-containing protein [Planctomycetota bacterium]|nr:DUF6600 domain-containing protein [Planctomycetota bacterium]
MRFTWMLCGMALLGLALAGNGASASEGFEDIAKLAKAGVTEEQLVTFVKASPVAYDLGVDEILYLSDLGVTPAGITAIVDHGKDLRAGKTDTTAKSEIADNTDATEKAKSDAAKEVDEDNGNGATTLVSTNTSDNSNADSKTNTDSNSDVSLDKTQGPIADSNDGKLILASPLSSDVLHEQESVRDTVAAPVAVSAPADGAITTATFYESLTPYGTWIKIDDVWCWQPSVTVCNPDWRPYFDRGHWDATDCGWFWQSDYSWGWAPFHYGRWKHCAGYGWLWTPDTVWSPAWVSWRECDSDYGWAPLPPSCGFDAGFGFRFRGRHFGFDIGFGLGFGDYCFVSADHFTEFSLRRFREPRDRAIAIFNRSTIIQNNVTIINNKIVVNGPKFENVQKFSKQPITRLHLADATIHAGQTIARTAHEDRRNGTLQIFRPQVKTTALETPATVAKMQLATFASQVHTSADPKLLAMSHRADEIRAKQFAALDVKHKTVETLQIARVKNPALKNVDVNQQKLSTTLRQTTDNKVKLDGQKTFLQHDAQIKTQQDAQQKLQLEKTLDTRRKTELETPQRNFDAAVKHDSFEAQHQTQVETTTVHQTQIQTQTKTQDTGVRTSSGSHFTQSSTNSNDSNDPFGSRKRR